MVVRAQETPSEMLTCTLSAVIVIPWSRYMSSKALSQRLARVIDRDLWESYVGVRCSLEWGMRTVPAHQWRGQPRKSRTVAALSKPAWDRGGNAENEQ